MLLSHRYNFLFVHIAKTGGTSVRAALDGLRWRDPLYYLAWPCHRLSHFTGHRTATKFPRHARIVAAKEMLPAPFFERLFKFAFVRNPWDMQVSSYHHLRRERPALLGAATDFESFLRYKLDPERPYQYHIDTSLQLQVDYLVDLYGAVQVDFIGRYERLDDDFREVCERIGVAHRTLPHRRKATDRGADYRAYYSDDTAQLLAAHFARDIEVLGYRFDPEPAT